MAHKSSFSSSHSGVTRRQFGKQAAWAGITAALAGTPALGQQVSTRKDSEGPAGDSEARYEQIIRRYGKRLSEEQRKRLRKILAYNEKLLAPIRAFPLENGQPAATVLKFYDEQPAARPRSQRTTPETRTKE